MQTFMQKVSCKHCLAPWIQRRLESVKALLFVAVNFILDTGKSSCQPDQNHLVQRAAATDKWPSWQLQWSPASFFQVLSPSPDASKSQACVTVDLARQVSLKLTFLGDISIYIYNIHVHKQ